MSAATEDIPLGATFTEEQARQIFSQGEDTVVFVILELAKKGAIGRSARDAGPRRLGDGAPDGLRIVVPIAAAL